MRRRQEQNGDYRDIICPFYRHHGGCRIGCEGIIPDTYLQTDFANARELRQQLEIFCSEHFTKCEVYRAIVQKYEEDDQL